MEYAVLKNAFLRCKLTAILDSARSHEISAVLQELNQREGLTVILVTHNTELAKTAHRIVELRVGVLLPLRACYVL